MSYRVDIPTLSANEVYTLTFEYEGTETIQLTVGDLILETTDRRVVFTTTSSVDNIKSNVKLQNLDIYEGYYESDDFGGEYTQESYIEGKTEIIDNVVKCVKSPKIVSYPKYPNIAPNCKRNLSDNTPIAYRSDDNSYIKITDTTRWVGVTFGYYPQDFGYATEDIFCLEFDVVDHKGTGTISGGTASVVTLGWGIYLNPNGSNTTNYYINTIGHHKVYFQCTGDSASGRICELNICLNTGTSGINTVLEIDNLKVYKINDVNDANEYEDSIITTPDDLELHGLSDVQDTLDLTTGTYTQRVKKWNLAEEGYILLRTVTNQEAQGYVRFDFRQPQVGASGNPTCILNKATHINNLGLPNLREGDSVSYLDRCLGVAANSAFLMLKLKTTDVTSYDKAGLDEWIKANDFTIYYNAVFSGIDSRIKTETYQVNVKPLKSYRNGSITTSSQQLVPTLKTTLPISNKFTTTNLTSGSTYNVYFDGTATKLDAGGTIITNPISPCEVECGGTTLTIEGTDIQNVRVLETTVKNEIGNNGTSDVILSKIITSEYENIVNDAIYLCSVGNGNTYIIDNESGTIFTKGNHTWGSATFTSNKNYPKGLSLLHIECDVDMSADNLMAIISFGNGVATTNYNFRDLTLNNDTATIAQGQGSGVGVQYSSIVKRGHLSRLMYNISSEGTIKMNINTGSSAMITAGGNNAEGSTSGYTACTTNGVTISNLKIRVVENYPDVDAFSQITSLLRTNSGLDVIWQDMDLSFGYVVSNLEQPIKLRNLGTTYDSYNPVTGELVKRIGVSETDGSYIVLSSPIVSGVNLDNTPQLYTNGQVKVYSDSKVYPTTILNGQSTNNYEIDGLQTSNNYTIRYEGECESINFANKSNTQGNNVLVKPGATSGNLTFVNDSGDINNVLLVQNDVREQEINHFTGLETVEVSRMLVQNCNNMFDMDNCESYPQAGNSADVITKEFIPVLPNETLYCNYTKGMAVYSYIYEYDENKTQINSVMYSGHDGAMGGFFNQRIVTLRNNTHYIRITGRGGYLDQIMVNRGTDYLPYEKCKSPYQGAYIDLPQSIRLYGLPDGTCDTYNPITGEYIQNVGIATYEDVKYISREVVSRDKKWVGYWLKFQGESSNNAVSKLANIKVSEIPIMSTAVDINTVPFTHIGIRGNKGGISLRIPVVEEGIVDDKGTGVIQWLKDNDIHMYYNASEPIITQLEPIQIPVFEGGILQLITTDGKVFPMIEYSMNTENRYDISTWKTEVVYTQRNMTEVYFNESTTPMTPTETMTLTANHISSGSIIANHNGDGLVVLKGNHTGRDIPYFTGMRDTEAIEITTMPSSDQPLFGKGGRK